MLLSALATILVLLSAATADPLTWDEGPQTLRIGPKDVDFFGWKWGLLRNQTINASRGKLWIRRRTSIVCDPENKSSCSQKTENATLIHVWRTNTLTLDVSGQEQKIYIDPKGAARYTRPKFNEIPEGSITTGWYEKWSTYRGFEFLHEKGGNWIACAAKKGKGPYQVFFELDKIKDENTPSKSRKDCIVIELSGIPWRGELPGAWQYS
ncbi:hypothetical protein TWF281_006185 [Arthrobotrys megalospora]